MTEQFPSVAKRSVGRPKGEEKTTILLRMTAAQLELVKTKVGTGAALVEWICKNLENQNIKAKPKRGKVPKLTFKLVSRRTSLSGAFLVHLRCGKEFDNYQSSVVCQIDEKTGDMITGSYNEKTGEYVVWNRGLHRHLKSISPENWAALGGTEGFNRQLFAALTKIALQLLR